MDVSNSKLEFHSRPARKFLPFWRIFTDVKTSVWALTETLPTGIVILDVHQQACHRVLDSRLYAALLRELSCGVVSFILLLDE